MQAWLAIASKNHVLRGRAGGFMQVCHGKSAPLKRIKPHDTVIYYSPTLEFGSKAPCRAFTIIGEVTENEPYAFDMGNGFVPYRRTMRWFDSEEVKLDHLKHLLHLTADKGWGYALRFGLLKLEADDYTIIHAAMCGKQRLEPKV